MATESFPGIGPVQSPKAEKPHNSHPHRGRHVAAAALSVTLVAAGSGGVAWWLRSSAHEKGGSAANGTSGNGGGTGGGENNHQPIGAVTTKPSSKAPLKPAHTASPSHAPEKGSDTKDLKLECTLGSSAITKTGTQLRVTPILTVRGGHPDASRFYTVADVVTGTTEANRHVAGTYAAQGKAAAVTATVPKDMQFPRDDVPVQVFYFPFGQQIPSTEHMSITAPANEGIVVGCGNASLTYALGHGGITLPDGASFPAAGS